MNYFKRKFGVGTWYLDHIAYIEGRIYPCHNTPIDGRRWERSTCEAYEAQEVE